jgi:hypothetical protein
MWEAIADFIAALIEGLCMIDWPSFGKDKNKKDK